MKDKVNDLNILLASQLLKYFTAERLKKLDMKAGMEAAVLMDKLLKVLAPGKWSCEKAQKRKS